MLRQLLAELLVTWFPSLKNRDDGKTDAGHSLGRPIDRADRWPRGRKIMQCVAVFDPDNDYHHVIIKSGFDNMFLLVYEDCTGDIDVKYLTKDELPRNCDQWFE